MWENYISMLTKGYKDIIQLLDIQRLKQTLFSQVFSEAGASCMHINTCGLSRHKAKPSKQSSPATLSLTKIFLYNTNDYLAYTSSCFQQEVFHAIM